MLKIAPKPLSITIDNKKSGSQGIKSIVKKWRDIRNPMN